VIICEGIPDTLSVLVAGLKDTGACGLNGTSGWQPAWLPLFRRAGRVYVAIDRDATDRAIALARTFGTRGRVLVPPEELGPKGDLNDWLRVRAKGDAAAFRSILERALATSPTPWALQIQRLPPDLAPWDLEDHAGVRDLLCELGASGATEPRCALAPFGGTIRGRARYSAGSGLRARPKRGRRVIANTPAGRSDSCRQAILPDACEGIPGHPVWARLRARDIGACGLYGTGGWQPAWLPLFRRADWMYIELDRDATDRTTQPAWCWHLPSNNTHTPHRSRFDSDPQHPALRAMIVRALSGLAHDEAENILAYRS
jgi:hypothetical protein